MAKLIPDLTESQLDVLESPAEAKVYRALRDQLPADYTIFFRVGWILRREDEHAKDGETDFIVCHPNTGYLCIEVKGGGVGFDADTGEWYSIDRFNNKHPIKNPIGQALRAKYSIRTKLNEQSRWRDLGIRDVIRGHAVFFPDIGNPKPLARPDMPVELIGSLDTLQQVRTWVDGAFAHWRNEDSSQTPIGHQGIHLFREIFARSFEARPLVSAILQEQETRRLRLTQDQLRVLDLLRSHRRAAVSGGAGTGKTVLAVEKARRLATEGFRTLLTCYNRQLADHLQRVCQGTPGLQVMSFHQLCHWLIERAKQASGTDPVADAQLTYPGKDYFDVQLPNALAYSLMLLPDRYDAVVCDEGQDFKADYWMPIEFILSDASSPLYIFYDDNQNLYSRVRSFPIADAPFLLTFNCRNTDKIHEAAYRHYRGVPVDPPSNVGEAIIPIEAPHHEQQAKRLHARIVDLIAKESVAPSHIVVLIAESERKQDYYAKLRRLPLPRPAQWMEEAPQSDQIVLLETVKRFKGLEAPIVFLWGLDMLNSTRRQELLYVGISRAKSMLYVVGNANTIKSVLAS
ncbi:MAG TPA: ATP-dependent helicase [Candidatus Competibacteraceae bacterium]|nr:ATP-dependent helicase [Candidatus Competibacteraceae bacterium]HRZ07515.1 ATP-dependent helicase [Candidatus Competibacteraceae bacterium]HSA47914.1 ATP-dependent helicase [Candidatus Competibacteraceae bacterium]